MLGMGCPVVASAIPEQKIIMKLSGGGICGAYDAIVLGTAVIYLLKNKEKAIKMGQQGRKYMLKNRTYKKLAQRLHCIFQTL